MCCFQREQVSGLTKEHLDELMQMTKNIPSSIDDWDPDMLQSTNVQNAIKSAIAIHSGVLKDKKLCRSHWPITLFSSTTNEKPGKTTH